MFLFIKRKPWGHNMRLVADCIIAYFSNLWIRYSHKHRTLRVRYNHWGCVTMRKSPHYGYIPVFVFHNLWNNQNYLTLSHTPYYLVILTFSSSNKLVSLSVSITPCMVSFKRFPYLITQALKPAQVNTRVRHMLVQTSSILIVSPLSKTHSSIYAVTTKPIYHVKMKME